MSFLLNYPRFLINNYVRGTRFERKIIVFESDDWGSVRVPNREVYEFLSKKISGFSNNPYNCFDSLESESDLNLLSEVLSLFADSKGHHPKFTLNFIVANPDFTRIEKSNFLKYYYSEFTESYKSYGYNSFQALKEGINAQLLKPQYHGREHLNVVRWMKLLKDEQQEMLLAFRNQVFSIDFFSKNKRNNIMAALDHNNKEEQLFSNHSLIDGLNIFKKHFGFVPTTFIAPCNVWHDDSEKILKEGEIKVFQSLYARQIPTEGDQPYKIRYHYTGERNVNGQFYLVRNAYFEPSTLSNYPWVENCLKKINTAFMFNKPAIISTHRLNYTGGIFEENRGKNLTLLKELLGKIMSRWPDVEFMSSDELAQLYLNK